MADEQCEFASQKGAEIEAAGQEGAVTQTVQTQRYPIVLVGAYQLAYLEM